MMRRSWTAAREKVEREGRCRRCRSPRDVQAAHIWPRSLGGGDEALGIVPLCRICHERYDRHVLDLLPVLTADEQAFAVLAAGSIARAYERLAPLEYGNRKGTVRG